MNERVAYDAYARFAAYYDLEYAGYDADLDFYRQFAIQANGPVLELGCGTGRVLSALTELELPLAGIDNSPSMLEIARSRLPDRVSLVECDIRAAATCRLPHSPYWMAFSAINTFLHLPNVEAQIEALETLRAVVVAGGLLLLDLMIPEPNYLATLDGRITLELTRTLPNEDRLDKWVARTHDLATQTIDTTVFYDVTSDATGHMTRVADRYATRYIHQFELEHLLARTGWRLISLYGSYELDPLHSDSERMLALATWGTMEHGLEEPDWLRSS